LWIDYNPAFYNLKEFQPNALTLKDEIHELLRLLKRVPVENYNAFIKTDPSLKTSGGSFVISTTVEPSPPFN